VKYFLLIFTDESKELRPGDNGWDALWRAYVDLDNAARDASVLLDSQPFAPGNTARTVTVKNGSPVVEPGPALQQALQPAGYYLLECASEDEAVHWAARIPAAATGKVEVRAIFEPGDSA
jgi:hypothetical protein